MLRTVINGCVLLGRLFSAGTGLHAQWERMALPEGSAFRYLATCDNGNWYGVSNDRVFKWTPFGTWTDVSPFTIQRARSLTVWNDTVVIYAGHNQQRHVLYSLDGGASWNTTPTKENELAVIYHTTSYVAWDARVPEGRILMQVDFVSGDTVFTDPVAVDAGIGGYLMSCDGHLFSKSTELDDSTDLHALYRFSGTSPDIRMWTITRDTSYLDPQVVQPGGMGLFDRTRMRVFKGRAITPIELPVPTNQDHLYFDVIQRGSDWLVKSRLRGDTRLHVYTPGKPLTEIDVDYEAFELGSMMHATPRYLTAVHSIHGVATLDLETQTLIPLGKGLAAPGALATDGRYVATTGFRLGNSTTVYVWDDRDPLRRVDTIVITDAPTRYNYDRVSLQFVGGYLWVGTYWLWRIDLPSREMQAGRRISGYFNNEDNLSVRNDSLFIGSGNGIYSRSIADTAWSVAASYASRYGTFQGTEAIPDGYVTVRWDNDSANIYRTTFPVQRLDLNGNVVGRPLLIDSIYGDVIYMSMGMRRSGDHIVVRRWLDDFDQRPAIATEDNGATWTVPRGGWVQTSFDGLYDVQRRSGADRRLHYSSDLGRTWSQLDVPVLPDLMCTEAFCLQNNCYLMTETGVFVAPRQTVGVHETTPAGAAVDAGAPTMRITGSLIHADADGDVNLFDLSGRHVAHVSVERGETPVPSLSPGVYLVRYRSAAGNTLMTAFVDVR